MIRPMMIVVSFANYRLSANQVRLFGERQVTWLIFNQ